MAKARMSPAKRKRIYIARKEDKGDIQISGGVAKIRLTPKVLFLFFLFIALAVAIVFLAARQGRQTGMPLPQVASAVPASPGSLSERTPGNQPPIVSMIEISTSNPTAQTVLNLKYGAIDSEGDGITYSFRWYVNDRSVQDGPEPELRPGSFKKGDSVRAEVSVSDPQGNGEPVSSQPVLIGNLPPAVASVAIDPQEPALGAQLTAVPSASDPDDDALTCQYQWSVNGHPSGPPSSTVAFQTEGLKKQDAVTVSLVCSDGSASAGPVVSKPVTFGNRMPEILSTAPDSVENGVYAYQVSARDPDGDTLRYRLEHGPAGITIDPASGLIHWTVPKGGMYTGRHEIPVKVTVDDGNGGAVSQEFFIVLVDYVAY